MILAAVSVVLGTTADDMLGVMVANGFVGVGALVTCIALTGNYVAKAIITSRK